MALRISPQLVHMDETFVCAHGHAALLLHVDCRIAGRSSGTTKALLNSALFQVSPAGMKYVHMDPPSIMPD
jgi:hypothetical protein